MVFDLEMLHLFVLSMVFGNLISGFIVAVQRGRVGHKKAKAVE